MKILFCIAGGGMYGILDDDILKRTDPLVYAKRAFSLEILPAQVKSPRGENMNFTISTYKDIMVSCSFIADMSEDAMFYQKITEIITKERANEN